MYPEYKPDDDIQLCDSNSNFLRTAPSAVNGCSSGRDANSKGSGYQFGLKLVVLNGALCALDGKLSSDDTCSPVHSGNVLNKQSASQAQIGTDLVRKDERDFQMQTVSETSVMDSILLIVTGVKATSQPAKVQHAL